jgi:D-alanyl-D-alanine carboxypeptidase/D-alanyl-D-alanine-endopeptidase (penicillin-binding protein 4)
VFYQPAGKGFIMTGTIPCCVDSFRIRGAIPDPNGFALGEIARMTGARGSVRWGTVRNANNDFNAHTLYVHQSPPLDSIIYWFLQKSINLYGEALVHTLAREKNGFATVEDGLHIIRQFWKGQGIDTGALNIVDGSGLSPQNRVTAKALTQVMRYARARAWYPAFYAALPVYNGIRMKSGTIGGVKSYTGYVKSKSGREYAFAIMVNNFAGSASLINRKIFAVLDVLK